jgi:hypothetical protein
MSVVDGYGGILLFSDALKQNPNANLVVYNRVSYQVQAGPRPEQAKLKQKTTAVVEAIHAAAPGRSLDIFQGVEQGKLFVPRPTLQQAVEFASSQSESIIVAWDQARFLRSRSFHQQRSPMAWPTLEEFARLREMTKSIPLATVIDPAMNVSERHGHATRLTEKAGRPPKIDPALADEIFRRLGHLFLTPSGRWRWERPLAKVANEFGVSPQAILRIADTPGPTGVTRRAAALLLAAHRGLIELRGEEVIPLHNHPPWSLADFDR